MANDVLTLLTSEAVTIFRSLSTITTQQNPFANVFLASDAVMNEAQGLVNPLQLDTPGMQQLVDRIFSDPDFDILAPKDGELDPMILYPGGGMRGPVNGLIMGIFHSALLQIYYLRQPNNESTFVRNAIDGFEELRRAVRGERVRCYLITGIARRLLCNNSVGTDKADIRENTNSMAFPFYATTNYLYLSGTEAMACYF
jgi:hypothetical protein